MPIIYNRTKRCYSIAGLIIITGVNKISKSLLEDLMKHDLFQDLLKSHKDEKGNKIKAYFKILKNKKKAIRKEIDNSIPAGVSQEDKKKIIESVKINEIIGTLDETQLGSKDLSKEQKKAIKDKCKELGIASGGKSFKALVDLINEKENEVKEDEEEDENEDEEEDNDSEDGEEDEDEEEGEEE